MSKQPAIIVLLACYLAACAGPDRRNDAVHPKQAAIYNAQLGHGYLAQGNYKLSKDKFEKALDQDASLPQAHAGYALLMSQLGQTKQAEKHFKRALRGDPYNSDTLNNYGTFLCSQNKIKEAEEQFMAALRDPLYKTPEYAFTNAGRCSMKIPDLDKAEGFYGKALQSNPQFPDALFEMARLYEKKRNYNLAYSYVKRFDQSGGTHTPASLWLAIRLARFNGDKNAEANYVLRLKSRFPKSEEAAFLRSANKQN